MIGRAIKSDRLESINCHWMKNNFVHVSTNVMRFLGRFLDDGRLGVVVAAVAIVIFVVALLAVLLLPQRHVGECVFFAFTITSTLDHTPNVVK